MENTPESELDKKVWSVISNESKNDHVLAHRVTHAEAVATVRKLNGNLHDSSVIVSADAAQRILTENELPKYE